MQVQFKSSHLRVNPVILFPRHSQATPFGTLSKAELRRIVADMVD
jgi:hypothetical protein